MKMQDQVLDGEEYAFRCPQCGDSTRDQTKAHASINVRTGLIYCFRCGWSGKASFEQMSENEEIVDAAFAKKARWVKREIKPEELEPLILPGPAIARPSALSRFHLTNPAGTRLDVFQSRDPDGNTVGYYLRYPEKKFLAVGKRLFGYSEQNTWDDYLRVVEGPYDVVDKKHDLCLFGNPGKRQIELLRFYPLVLCPDGDVWADPAKTTGYLNQISRFGMPNILWVEKLPPDKDPDEVAIEERKRISFKELLSWNEHRQRALTSTSSRGLRGLGRPQYHESWNRGESRSSALHW